MGEAHIFIFDQAIFVTSINYYYYLIAERSAQVVKESNEMVNDLNTPYVYNFWIQKGGS